MFRKTHLGGFLVLAVVLIAIPMENVTAAPSGGGVPGAWTCTVVRAGTIERPIIYTFGADGIFNYSSGTTINNTSESLSPVYNSGFHSRGGGHGQWTKVSTNVVNYKSVELLYDANGNAAGSFSVNANLLLTGGQLCSGRDECPNQTSTFSLVKYQFAGDNPDGDIVGITALLGPGALANVLCNSLSSGAGFPGLLIPTP